MPSSSVLNCFYLLISKFEKLTTWIWRLPFAENVILNDRNVMVNFRGALARAQRSTGSKKKLVIYASRKFGFLQNRPFHPFTRMWNGKLARSPRHILSPWFNLVLDIHVMVKWQLYPLTSITWLYRGLRYTTHWGNVCFKSYSPTSLRFSIERGLKSVF